MKSPATQPRSTPGATAVRALVFGVVLSLASLLGLLLLPPAPTGGEARAQPQAKAQAQAQAQAKTPSNAKAAAAAHSQGLLWKIDGAGPAPSFLFGTIHLDDPRVTNLPPAVRQSLDAASSFTMEVTFDASNLLQLASRMVYLDGRDLPGVIGDELYKRLAAESSGLGIPGELLRVFRPWAAALLLMMPQQQPGDILDNVLLRIATEQQKPVHQLETVDEQVATFETLAEADQVVMLRHAIDSRDRAQQLMARLVDAWLARDLAAMSRIDDEANRDSPEMKRLNDTFRKRLLDERNTRMMERMQPQLKQGGAFVAVGALHLYGPNGLLSLLEKRGYRVTRLY